MTVGTVQNAQWHARNPWIIYVFWAVVLPVFVFDILLVELFDVRSISARLWEAEEFHPTIRVLITLTFVLIGYLVRSNLWAFGLSMILLGHLAINQ